MKKAALILMVITLLAKILGFGRELTLSYYYGTSRISDIYLVSLTIPTTIFALIATAISTSYIPIYSKIFEEAGEDEADKFTSNIINLILLVCVIITMSVFVFAEPIVKLFASGFEGQTLQSAVYFTKVNIFVIFFSGIIYIFNGKLQLKSRFFISELVVLPFNLLVMISIMLSSVMSIKVLAFGNVFCKGNTNFDPNTIYI